MLITGASGQLGGYLLQGLKNKDVEVIAWSGSQEGDRWGRRLQRVDLTDRERVAAAFRAARPDVVIHAGAITTMADCFRDARRAENVNVQGTAVITELAAETGARLLFVSTDLVFNGEKGWYRETDLPSPVSVYGRTKFAAEQVALGYARAAVIRTSLMFGPTLIGRPAFFDHQIAALRDRRPLRLFEDEWRTPLSLVTAARALLALTSTEFAGLIHVGGPERLSRLEMGLRLAAFLGLDPSPIVASTRSEAVFNETRPRDVSLDSSRCRQFLPELAWPGWSEAVAEQWAILRAEAADYSGNR
jgi:dTDP-4-dehydrorhamnose reductase